MSITLEEERAAIASEIAGALLAPFHETNNSDLFLLTAPGLDGRIVLKYPRAADRAAAEALAREEYAALAKVYEGCGEPRVCPRPFDALLHRGALGLDYVDAETLRARLCGGLRHDRKLDLMRAAGAALRKLHDLPPPRRQAVDAPALLDQIAALRPDFPVPALGRRAEECLRETAGPIDGRELPVAHLHGDCKPDNVLCPGEDVLLIDLVLRQENFAVFDVAYFLNSCFLIGLEPAGLRALALRARAERAFLDGYGFGDDGADAAMLAWFRLRSALLSWCSAAPAGWLRRTYANMAARLLIGHLSRRLRACR